jgi:maltooligosyltrehalose trehalohydrolase
MHVFRVWAPRTRKSMAVEVKGKRLNMERQEDGWWTAEVSGAGPGTDYAFCIDGGEPLPDPRSPWQPYGVHGPSRVVDHGAFRWGDEGWQAKPLPSALVYELHVGTFTPSGTFEGVIDRLDYLAGLGVTHVELMPVNGFSGTRGWGYDGVNLYAPHAPYGGPEGLKRLVDACHRRGLAVLLDVVYNHLGPEGNYLGQYGPYFTDQYRCLWGEAVNFDRPGSDEVRRFFCDNALMWLRDYHADGLRLDAVHAFMDNSATHFLEQLSTEVADLGVELGRHLVLIAESDLNNPRLVQSREAGGYGLDAQWSDDFHHVLHALVTGARDGYYEDFGKLSQLGKALQNAYVYDGQFSPHRGRSHGRPHRGLAGYRFLGYLQNHDQVGNRARGERIHHLTEPRRALLGAALVLTSPFVPMLFQGEEWAASSPFLYFTGHEDAELNRLVSEGRRREFAAFGWKPEEIPDPSAEETFQRSQLRWEELEGEPHARVLAWYRELIRLRRALPALGDGRLESVRVRCEEEEGWLAFERGPVTVALNFSREKRRVELSSGQPDTLLLASGPDVRLASRRIELPAESVAVFGPESGLARRNTPS